MFAVSYKLHAFTISPFVGRTFEFTSTPGRFSRHLDDEFQGGYVARSHGVIYINTCIPVSFFFLLKKTLILYLRTKFFQHMVVGCRVRKSFSNARISKNHDEYDDEKITSKNRKGLWMGFLGPFKFALDCVLCTFYNLFLC